MTASDHGSGEGIATARELVSANWLAGLAVVDPQGARVGEIAHVMLDVPSGTIAYGVVACARPDAGERLIAVPWRSLAFDSDGRFFVIHLEPERLRQAPQRPRAEWPLLIDAQFAAEMRAYYGVPSTRD